MQLDWRPCKCRGRFDVPLGARDRLVDAVTPDGIVTDTSDNVDWGKVSKWRDASPSPETNVRVDYHELLMRLQAVQHATDRPYAASVAKDAGDAIKALLASQPPSPQAQPFAWYWHDQHGCLYITGDDRKPDVPAGAKPLYEHAPQEQTTGLPQDVINLVIAAREFWDGNNDLSHESRALDKALTAFSERVPYENQPDEDENNG